MASGQAEKKPQPGDLIEIFRGVYQHWGIYVGDGFIIHLAPPCEQAQAGANSMMSVMHHKAMVKKELLCEVAGNNEYRVNNLQDEKYEPRPIDEILQEAHALLGMELPYCFIKRNCEHFATELRYGKAESRQVRKAVEVGGIGVLAFFGVVLAAAAASFIGSRSKREEENDE